MFEIGFDIFENMFILKHLETVHLERADRLLMQMFWQNLATFGKSSAMHWLSILT